MDNWNLIQKIGWAFHKTTGHSPEDLLQEAYLAYAENINKYDEKKGAKSTFLWYCISSHIKNYLRLEEKYSDGIVNIESIFFPVNNSFKIEESLSKDAILLLHTIMECDAVRSNIHKRNYKTVLKGVAEEYGWSDKRLIKIINELKTVIQ